MAQAIRAILLASAIAATFVGRRANSAVSQGRCLVPWSLAERITASAPAVNRLRRYRSPRLLMLPSFSLPPLEFCFGTSPIQAEKSRPERKALASPTLATRAVANAGPTPGISSSRLLVSLDRCQAMISRSNSRIWVFSTRRWAPRATRHARNLGYAFVTGIGDNIEQCLDPIASDRRDDAELGKMGTDRIDHCSLLADEQVACAMQHQTALLLGRLGLDKSHVCPGHRFADCLGVGGIVLLPLHIRLHVGRRHQAHSMTQRLEFARPMMRGCAGLDTDKTWRQLLEESSDVTALQFAPDDHFPFGVDAVNLKNRFCDIETNCRDRLHGLAPPNQVTPLATMVVALTCRWRSRPQHHKRTISMGAPFTRERSVQSPQRPPF